MMAGRWLNKYDFHSKFVFTYFYQYIFLLQQLILFGNIAEANAIGTNLPYFPLQVVDNDEPVAGIF